MSSDDVIELLAYKGQVYAALVNGEGDICRSGIYHPEESGQLGDIHWVKILKSVPGLSGAFVLLEKNVEGFLPYRKNYSFQEGDFLAASITREAQHGKGLRLKALPDLKIPDKIKNEKKPFLLKRGKSLLQIWAEEFPRAEIRSPHPEIALYFPKEIRSRFQIDYNAFDAGLKEAFEALGDPHFDLSHGIEAHLCVTEALTAIDLDAPQGAGFEENRRAIEKLLREIELRHLGGVILIDPAGLPLKKRFALTKFIQEYAKQTFSLKSLNVLGATPSGMIELSVKRERKSLFEALQSLEEQGV
ncbi:hypothetical protein FAI41_05975 [Acetobacteraceae bacterium]|nr:hypothetical protein FAI41_05975 [Acetobacteraceae bacterium]